jgi:carbonic anhydrase
MRVRRQLLVGSLLVASLRLAASDPAHAPVSAQAVDSGEAFRFLVEGNARFMEGKPSGAGRDEARRLDVAKNGQHPFATVLSCSDSRVPVELLFDQGIGDVFVVRVAGNVSDTDEIGTIEYGVGHLHTPLLVVMGHTSCGAVKAVMEGSEVHGSIPALVDNVAPAVRLARAKYEGSPRLFQEAVRMNVWMSIEDVFKRSEEVRSLVKAGKLQVVGALYVLETGAVIWMGEHPEKTRLMTPPGARPAAPGGGARPATKPAVAATKPAPGGH